MELHLFARVSCNQVICRLPKKLCVFHDCHTNWVKKAYPINGYNQMYIEKLMVRFRKLYFHPKYNI